MSDIKTYSELITLGTFKERFNYLKLDSIVGAETFGYDRYLNQNFYRSAEWKKIRDHVIIRDNGCDLGMEGYEIRGRILIHHLNPIGMEDLRDQTEYLTEPEFLICTTHITHNAIHYGSEDLLPSDPVMRSANDTCPWRH